MTMDVDKGLTTTPFTDFFSFSTVAITRGHSAKLEKHHCHLELRRHFFSMRVVDRWKEATATYYWLTSLNSFKNGLTQLRKTRMGFFMDWLLLRNNNRKPYTIYRMAQLQMTFYDLWHRFQRHSIFQHLLSQKRHEIEPYSYYRTSIWSHNCSITWWYFQWPWRNPNAVFKVTAFFKSNISKLVHFRNKFTTEHYKETIHNLSNDTTLNDLEWPLIPCPCTPFWKTNIIKLQCYYCTIGNSV